MQSSTPGVMTALSEIAETSWEPVQELYLPTQQVNLIDIFCCSHPKGVIYHAYVWRDGQIRAFSSSLNLASIVAFCRQQSLSVVTNDATLQLDLGTHGIEASLLTEKSWGQE